MDQCFDLGKSYRQCTFDKITEMILSRNWTTKFSISRILLDWIGFPANLETFGQGRVAHHSRLSWAPSPEPMFQVAAQFRRGIHSEGVILWFYIICYIIFKIIYEYIFGLSPRFWLTAPQTLGIPSVLRVIKVSFVMWTRWLLEACKDGGWLPGETTTHVIRGLVFLCPPAPGRGWRLNQLPMANDFINHDYNKAPKEVL